MTQKEQIADLKKQLAEAKRNTYVGETHHLQCFDGELHIGYGSYPDDERWLVMDVNSLYRDLPFFIGQVVKEQKKQQKMYLDSIKETIKDI